MESLVFPRERRGLKVPPLARYTPLAFAMAGFTHVLSAVAGLLSGDVKYGVPIMLWGLGLVAVSLAWLAATVPSRGLEKGEAFILVALAWFLTPLISAVPVTAVLHVPLIDTWFEAISGYTTTGLSVFSGGYDKFFHVYIPSVQQLPPTILWWRAFCQWLGGFGIVVMFFVFARLGGLPPHLVGMAEGRYQRLEPSIARSLKALMALYAFLTALDVAFLMAAGMDFPDALYHSMTALSTGGFSPYNNSIAYFHSVWIEFAVIAGMLMGAFNFADMYALLTGAKRRLSGEIDSLLIITAVASLSGAFILMRFHTHWTTNNPFREAFFDVVSAVTTTGFSISNLGKAPAVWKYILTVLMIIGGSVFSTTGGIKQYRVIVMAKTVYWNVKKSLHGDVITSRRVGGETISADEFENVLAVITLFAATLIPGIIVIMLAMPHVGLADAAFEAASALATTGLSVGITSASAPLVVKLDLMALMLLGRLEVIGFLYAARAAWEGLARAAARRRASLKYRM